MATINSIGSNKPIQVAFGGTGQSTLLTHGVLVGNTTSGITSLGVGTNGQVLLGSTAADPVFATLTSTGNTISFTTGAGTLNLETVGGGSVAGTQTFSYYLASTVNNATGDATPYSILFDTALISNTNYNTANGRFTAPATGVYFFAAGCLATNVTTSASTTININIAKNNSGVLIGTYLNPTAAAAAGGFCGANVNGIISMTAGDYADVQLTLAGGTKTAGVLGGVGFTFFNGFRVA